MTGRNNRPVIDKATVTFRIFRTWRISREGTLKTAYRSSLLGDRCRIILPGCDDLAQVSAPFAVTDPATSDLRSVYARLSFAFCSGLRRFDLRLRGFHLRFGLIVLSLRRNPLPPIARSADLPCLLKFASNGLARKADGFRRTKARFEKS